MTAEIIIAAVKEHKATSMSSLWRAMGHGKINGENIKKVRALVPNIAKMFDANIKGASVDEVIAPPKKVAKKTKTTTAREKIFGFYVDREYGALVKAGSKEFVDKKELIAGVAKQFGVEERLVAYKYYVIANKGHKTNHGRVEIVKNSDGKVKIVPCVPETEPVASEPAQA